MRARFLLTRGGSVLATALLLSASLSAQKAMPSVKEMAQRVDHRYNTLRSLKTQFTENYDGLGIHRSESGTLYLQKPGRMRWDYSSPAGKVFVLDGKFAWFYKTGDPQVQRAPAKQLDDLRSPLRFLLGHTELEKELRGLTLTQSANGKLTLTGQPKGEENRIRQIALNVTHDGTITALKIEEMDGSTTSFSFTNQKPNPKLPAKTFQFTPPKGVPVVEAPPPV